MSEFEDPLRVGVGDDEEDEEQVASDNTHGVSEDKEDQDDGVLKVEEDTREEMIQSKSGETLKDKEVGTSEGKINDVTRVTVTDPVKQVSDHSFLPGVTTSHVEYLVISEFVSQGKRVEVRRRFNDFVALASLLSETKRGYFVYPRPDKGMLEAATSGRSENEFIEFRRADLERYLNKLCEHPVIGQGEEIRVFLTAEGKLTSSFEWQQLQPLRGSMLEGLVRLPGQLLGSDSSVPNVSDITKNARYTNDVLRMVRELGEKMKMDYTVPATLSEEEVRLRETRAGVESYSESLVEASRRCEKIVRELERLGSITGDVGLAFIRLAKYEDEFGGPVGQYSAFTSTTQKMASDSRRIGMASVRMSRLERTATEDALLSLDAVHTQLALAPAVIDALKEREDASITLCSIKDDLERKKKQLEVLDAAASSSDPVKLKKAEALKNDIAALEAAVTAAGSGYNEIKRRNLVELERWRRDRASEYHTMLQKFTSARSDYDMKASNEWQSVRSDLYGGADGHMVR